MVSSLAWVDAALVVPLAALAALIALHPIASSDGLWQLALGRVIHETGAIPHTDVFSAVHPNRSWVQFQWLWEWLAYGVHQLGGFRLLRAGQALLMAGSVSLVYLVTQRLSSRRSLSFCVASLALFLYADRFRFRPDAVNLLLTFALLPLWLRRERSLGVARSLALAGLTALWSNLHAGASLLALASVGAVFVGRALTNSGSPTDRMAIQPVKPLGLTLLGLFASPIFLPGMLHFVGIYRFMVDTGNAEWAATWSVALREASLANLTIAVAPTVVAVLYAIERYRAYQRHGRAVLDGGELLLCAGYLVLAHHAVRNVFLCVVPFAFWAARWTRARSVPASRGWVVLSVLLLTLTAHRHLWQAYGGLRSMGELLRYDLAPGEFPEQAADWMRARGIRGGVLNHGRWAGYLIWRLHPAGNGVFVDTRYDVTPEMFAIFRRTQDPFTRPAAMDEAFARYGVELALFPAPVLPLDGDAPWKLLYRAGEQALYQHVEGEHAAHNLAQRDRWLAASGSPRAVGVVERTVVRVGGEQWLDAPYQRYRLQQYATSRDPARLRHAAGIHYRAGQCRRAIKLWKLAGSLEPLTAVSRVRWAHCLHQGGAQAMALRALEGIDPRRLPAEERLRMAWVRSGAGTPQQGPAAP